MVYRGLWLGTPVAIKKWFDSHASVEQRAEIRQEIITVAVRLPRECDDALALLLLWGSSVNSVRVVA